MDDYDVIVIGTGTAAQVVSSRVRRAGRSVAMIDHLPFGGTCALRGCDPKSRQGQVARPDPDRLALVPHPCRVRCSGIDRRRPTRGSWRCSARAPDRHSPL
jgi:hypothetical protein